jgi:hypothetical protein
MKHRGPIITLAAGALLAAVLLVIDVNSEPPAVPATAVGPLASHTTIGGSIGGSIGKATPSPSPTPVAVVNPGPPNATFAGEVDRGNGASIAIAVHNGQAVAYLCDGHTEAWLQGDAASAAVALTGANHALITATFAGNRITGTITAAGHTWTFAIGAVAPPSGLYRATAEVRSAKVVGGWIVLPNGRQVGVVDVDGQPGTAAPLDTTTLTSTVEGTSITAAVVDGSPIQLGQ